MRLSSGQHLGYCTNIHRGETWAEVFHALEQHVMVVRERVCPGQRYGIGLRLGEQAVRDLRDPPTLVAFLRWLEQKNCYVFTINGFPYGRFHGTRVKEQVYWPDWTTDERLEYTILLFELLAQIVPEEVEGSVSTVPVSFKEFMRTEEQAQKAVGNLWLCLDQMHRIARRFGRILHLGLEPEPLCYLETIEETVSFFERLRAHRPMDTRLEEFIGVNYDCCHLAIEYEEPTAAIQRLREHDIRLSKIHLSNALKVIPTPAACQRLQAFQDEVYFHQVVERSAAGLIKRYRDLDVALAEARNFAEGTPLPEWRIHFHIPLHSQPDALLDHTADHLQGVLDLVTRQPGLCGHFEMETYTWEVMPQEMKNRTVEDQLVAEYQWTLGEFARRGISFKKT